MESVDKQVKKLINEIQETNLNYRKIIQAGIHKWVKDYQEGRIKIESVADLKKLIDLDTELQKENIFLLKTHKKLLEEDK
ncbi:hypothetical protein [Heyndrickxia camelliae]